MTRTEKILGWIYLVVQLVIVQIILLFINTILPQPMSEAELNFVYFAVNFLCITLIFHNFLIESGKLSLKNPVYCLLSAIYAFIGYLAINAVINIGINAIVKNFYPDFYNVNDASISAITKDNYFLMFIGTVILVPLTEEMLYRGLVFGLIYNKNHVLAYIVSTIAFSALHIVGYIGYFEPLHLLICFLQYIPASLCLAWAYARADSIWAPVLLHMSINLIATAGMR